MTVLQCAFASVRNQDHVVKIPCSNRLVYTSTFRFWRSLGGTGHFSSKTPLKPQKTGPARGADEQWPGQADILDWYTTAECPKRPTGTLSVSGTSGSVVRGSMRRSPWNGRRRRTGGNPRNEGRGASSFSPLAFRIEVICSHLESSGVWSLKLKHCPWHLHPLSVLGVELMQVLEMQPLGPSGI